MFGKKSRTEDQSFYCRKLTKFVWNKYAGVAAGRGLTCCRSLRSEAEAGAGQGGARPGEEAAPRESRYGITREIFEKSKIYIDQSVMICIGATTEVEALKKALGEAEGKAVKEQAVCRVIITSDVLT